METYEKMMYGELVVLAICSYWIYYILKDIKVTVTKRKPKPVDK